MKTQKPIMKSLLFLALALATPLAAQAQNHSTWRTATPAELASALPARAPVQKERIETEMRTASGIINSNGKLIAGVVLITAGYSADGKYSHYLLVQAPITIDKTTLNPGNYVLGWQRGDEELNVKLYEAASGTELGTAVAHRLPTGSRVESFRILPPSDHAIIQIGRFAIPYTLGD
jgi:hypothetical protein